MNLFPRRNLTASLLNMLKAACIMDSSMRTYKIIFPMTGTESLKVARSCRFSAFCLWALQRSVKKAFVIECGSASVSNGH